MLETIRKRERLLLVLTVVGLALAAVASTMHYARLDLTSSRMFTLSDAAKGLRDEIPESVRISYFVSKSLADRHPGPGEIEDFLRELESVSEGKIRVRVVDPGEDSAEADGFGVAAQQLQVVERSEQRVAIVYTGIVVEYLDRHETIPSVLSTATLEYELVKAVRTVVSNDGQVVGLLVGDGGKSLSGDYQTLQASLARAGYEPRELERGRAIDDDVDVLFVLGNSAMDRYDSAFVDAFVMRGGKAFFAVKGVDVRADYGLAASAVPDGGLLSLLSSYGFDVERSLVLDQSSLTVPFQTQGPTGSYQIQYLRYPFWIIVDERFVSDDSPMTARFGGLDLFWPSPLRLRPVDGVEYVELAKTSPKAWLQTERLAAGPGDQALYAIERDGTSGQYLLAASASGSWKSAFSAGDLPSRDGAPPIDPPRPVSEPTRMVVVSSADFLSDLMRMSDSGFNASFALNAADWLSSSDDLIAIRSRAVADTRLNRVDDEGLRDFLVAVTYVVCLGVVPLGVVAFAVVRSARRRRAEEGSRPARGGEA